MLSTYLEGFIETYAVYILPILADSVGIDILSSDSDRTFHRDYSCTCPFSIQSEILYDSSACTVEVKADYLMLRVGEHYLKITQLCVILVASYLVRKQHYTHLLVLVQIGVRLRPHLEFHIHTCTRDNIIFPLKPHACNLGKLNGCTMCCISIMMKTINMVCSICQNKGTSMRVLPIILIKFLLYCNLIVCTCAYNISTSLRFFRRIKGSDPHDSKQ